MRYHNITHDDMKNGDGLRVVLWVSGCSHHCPGCQNPETWDEQSGIEFDADAEEEIRKELEKNYISGITFSGGDPMYHGNRDEILRLAKMVKEEFSKTVWLYTGYRYEEIQETPVLSFVDVLVDGRYEQDKRDVSLPWKGSSNQRVIDVKKSILENQIILYESK